MVLLLAYGLLGVFCVGVLYMLAIWLLPAGEQIAPPAADVRQWALSERRLVAQDVLDVKLPVAVRGYRFAETDLLLDRLTEEIRLRDAEIAELRGEEPAPAPYASVPDEAEAAAVAEAAADTNAVAPVADPVTPVADAG